MFVKFKKLYSVVAVLLLLISYASPSIYASAATDSSELPAPYIQVVQDGTAVKESEDTPPIGELAKGAIVKVAKIEGEHVYFQWGKELAYVDVVYTQRIDPPSPDDYSYDSDNTNDSYVQIQEKSAVYSQNGEVIGYLLPGDTYPIFQETDEAFQVVIGSQLAYIQKTASITKTEQPSDHQPSEADSTTSTDPANSTDSTDSESSSNLNEAPSSQPTETTPASQPAESGQTSQPRASVATTAVQTTAFTASIKYFQVTVDKLPVYDNSTGKLVQVGTLEKGQVFPRIKDYGANWHEIQFGSKTAYVLKSSTIPVSSANLKTSTQTGGASTFTTTADAPVYDNSTGSLIQIATIQKGLSYPIIRDYGNWYEISISGRIAYIHKSLVHVDFKSSDRYFLVVNGPLPVYDNSTGQLVQVGTLEKGQVFPRVKDYGANWHQIKYGSGYGYVLKQSTEPATSASIKNLNSLAPTSQYFTTIADTAVYDNSSGSLVKFATIQKGVKYPILKDSGNWYMVDVSGRAGYVHKSSVKLPFKTTDRYFEVIEDRVTVYDNSTGALVPVAYLEKGQVFPRVSDGGNWHKIKYGQKFGYVWKESTRPPFQINVKNENQGLQPLNQTFFTLADVPVYDKSTGSLVRFAILKQGQSYPIIRDETDAVVIDLSGRIGYVLKNDIQVGPILRYTQYNLTLDEMLAIQMTKNPQTDLYRNQKSYVHSAYVQVQNATTFPTKGTVTATTLNVREGAGETYWIVGTLKQGAVVNIKAKVGDWYEIDFGPWKNAKQADVLSYLDPSRFSRDSKEYFQFLVLSETAGVPVSDINNKILANKGILSGKGQAFVEAAKQYHINEIYLISHSLLETGNGTSALANGILVDKVDGKPVTPKTVYNMYGIGAYDSCPNTCGAEYAYKQGWFTPEAAIIGGAQYIASQYISNPTTYKQDTLYKMRWNPANPGTHQYATDIGWAVKQVSNISRLYDLIDNYTLIFDIPVYQSSK
ncbi:SH3 domain-containing protein [Anoxybacteroides rupiense]|uniref:SH3 domain-containing protein n=1 Tax=Anoxybacteroides rupiense TaxID=311460 RepID=UPI001F09F067|nr:SH3 domain-containing protein [Anoxybacillus rupiensis]